MVAILPIVNWIPQLFTGYAHPARFIGVSLPFLGGEGRPVLGYDNIEKNVRCYQSQQLVGDVVYPTISIVSRYSLRRCRQLVDPCCYHLYSRLYFQLRALQIEGKRSTTAVSIARPVPATSPTGAPMEKPKVLTEVRRQSTPHEARGREAVEFSVETGPA